MHMFTFNIMLYFFWKTTSIFFGRLYIRCAILQLLQVCMFLFVKHLIGPGWLIDVASCSKFESVKPVSFDAQILILIALTNWVYSYFGFQLAKLRAQNSNHKCKYVFIRHRLYHFDWRCMYLLLMNFWSLKFIHLLTTVLMIPSSFHITSPWLKKKMELGGWTLVHLCPGERTDPTSILVSAHRLWWCNGCKTDARSDTWFSYMAHYLAQLLWSKGWWGTNLGFNKSGSQKARRVQVIVVSHLFPIILITQWFKKVGTGEN